MPPPKLTAYRFLENVFHVGGMLQQLQRQMRAARLAERHQRHQAR